MLSIIVSEKLWMDSHQAKSEIHIMLIRWAVKIMYLLTSIGRNRWSWIECFQLCWFFVYIHHYENKCTGFFLKHTFQFIVGEGGREANQPLRKFITQLDSATMSYSFIVCFFVIQLSLIGCDVIEMSSMKQRCILNRT